VSRLDATDVAACVSPELAYKFGRFRVCDLPFAPRLVLRAEPTTVAAPEGGELVTAADPLSPSEREEADGLRARIAAVLIANGLADQVATLDTPLAGVVVLGDAPPAVAALAIEAERLAALQRVPGDRYALYLLSP
jgi:hypothetical protein